MGQVVGTDATYTGNPAVFTGINGSVITGMQVPLSPVQDLHGYSKPWAAGAGNNKAYWPTLTYTSRYDVDYAISDNGNKLHIEGTATSNSGAWASSTSTIYSEMPLGPFPAGTYTMKAIGFVGQNESDRIVFTARYADGTAVTGANGQRLTSDSNVIPTGAGRAVTFTATDVFKIGFYLNVQSGTSVNCDVQIQLEVGSTLGSWEPYENECPITGTTEVASYRVGKNVARVAVVPRTNNGIKYTENADGKVHCKGTAMAYSLSSGSITGTAVDKRTLYAVPAGTYTVSNTSSVRLWVQCRNAENTADLVTSRAILSGNSYTYTFNEPAIIYVRAYILSGEVVDADASAMVTVGSTAATVYEPWQMKLAKTSWGNSVGVVYGGYLDPIAGELVSDMGNIQSYNGEAINEPWLSSLDEYVSGTTPTTGAQVVYPIEEAKTYSVTQTDIPAVVGLNYLWANNFANIDAIVRSPLVGFQGWLIKAMTNGTGVEIPLKYMRAETYTVTPDQRMEWSAERDVTGVLHRETVENLPPKVEFNTPLMTNSDINTLNGIIKAAFTNYLQRNITIQFYDPERDEYWEWDCYMPDVKYSIRMVDSVNHVVHYEELRYAFIGY